MTDAHIRRAMQCPHVGCDAWAIAATDDSAVGSTAHLWSCSNGHHGPRVAGTAD